jgi:hypothetical protein
MTPPRSDRAGENGQGPAPKLGLPAGLESAGRDAALEHGPDVNPTGERADHRHSVPGTMIPGGPRPAAARGEWERIREAAESASSSAASAPEPGDSEPR